MRGELLKAKFLGLTKKITNQLQGSGAKIQRADRELPIIITQKRPENLHIKPPKPRCFILNDLLIHLFQKYSQVATSKSAAAAAVLAYCQQS